MATVAECLTSDALEAHAPMIEFCRETQHEVYEVVGDVIMRSLIDNNLDQTNLPSAYIIELADGRTVGFPFRVTTGDAVTKS